MSIGTLYKYNNSINDYYIFYDIYTDRKIMSLDQHTQQKSTDGDSVWCRYNRPPHIIRQKKSVCVVWEGNFFGVED